MHTRCTPIPTPHESALGVYPVSAVHGLGGGGGGEQRLHANRTRGFAIQRNILALVGLRPAEIAADTQHGCVSEIGEHARLKKIGLIQQNSYDISHEHTLG